MYQEYQLCTWHLKRAAPKLQLWVKWVSGYGGGRGVMYTIVLETGLWEGGGGGPLVMTIGKGKTAPCVHVVIGRDPSSPFPGPGGCGRRTEEGMLGGGIRYNIRVSIFRTHTYCRNPGLKCPRPRVHFHAILDLSRDLYWIKI